MPEKAKDKKFLNNLTGLDLELSQSNRFFSLHQKPIIPQRDIESPNLMHGQVRRLFDRGDLIDSLDLNIGYESI